MEILYVIATSKLNKTREHDPKIAYSQSYYKYWSFLFIHKIIDISNIFYVQQSHFLNFQSKFMLLFEYRKITVLRADHK